MSDFTTWRSLVDGEEIGVIPDSVVTRPETGETSDQTVPRGVRIKVNTEWPSRLDCKFADATPSDSGVTRARLIRLSDEEVVDTITLDDPSAGDIISFNFDSLSSGEEFNMVVDAEGDTYLHEFNGDDETFPYESEDGNIEITFGAAGETGSVDNSHVFTEVGNLD